MATLRRYVAAGLPQEYPDDVRSVLIQGAGDTVPAPEVGRVLTEVNPDLSDWVPQVRSTPPVETVDACNRQSHD